VHRLQHVGGVDPAGQAPRQAPAVRQPPGCAEAAGTCRASSPAAAPKGLCRHAAQLHAQHQPARRRPGAAGCRRRRRVSCALHSARGRRAAAPAPAGAPARPAAAGPAAHLLW
jgi:hypothetical protein